MVEFPGEQLIMKVWSTLMDNGIGAALRPRQILREEAARTKARHHHLLQLTQAATDAEDIVAGRKRYDGQKLLDLTSGPTTQTPAGPEIAPLPLSLTEAQARTSEAREFKRFVNLEKIAVLAEDEAEAFRGQPVSGAEVNQDWFARWRAQAEDVSDEDMQRLWARLLAGEIRQPGSFSQHTVHFLARMSKSDAELLEKAASLNVQGNIFRADAIIKKVGISFADTLYLEDLGVLNGVSASLGGLQFQVQIQTILTDQAAVLVHNDCAIVALVGGGSAKSWEIPVYTISSFGRELISLAKVKSNLDYVREIAKHALSHGFTSVKIGNVVPALNGHTGIANLRNFLPD